MDKIQFYRENTVRIRLTFNDLDLTGCTVYFTVKSEPDNSEDDATALIRKDVTTHTDPTNGKTMIHIPPAESNVPAGNYGYDIKLKRSNNEQTTVKIGKCVIKDVYTLRAA